MRQRGTRRPWLVVGLIVIVATAMAVLASGTSAASATKWYVPAISPTEVSAGASVPAPTYTLSFQNSTSSTHPLGAVRATFPSGFSGVGVVANTLRAADGTKSWVSSVSGNTIELRASTSSNALTAGQSVSVEVSFAAQCAAGDYTIATDAVQDNKFSGPPGNKFQLQQSPPVTDPVLTVTTAGSTPTSIDLTASSPRKAGIPFTATVKAYDQCGNQVSSFTGPVTLSGLPSGPAPANTSPVYGAFSYATGTGTASVTAYEAGSQTLTATFGTLTDSETFTVDAGPATRLVVDPIPDRDGAQPGIQQVRNEAFSVHVSTFDAAGNSGAPVTDDTVVQLAVKAGTGTGSTGTSPVTIEAPSGAGASFSVSYTVSEYGVVVTASTVAGDSLTPDDSDAFDVLDVLVTAEATPGRNTTLSTAAGAKCDTDAVNTTCVTVVLPNGASQTVSLSEADCDDAVDFPDGVPSSSCIGNLLGFFGDVKDANGDNLYGTGEPGQKAPFKIITEFDKTISGNTGAPKVEMFFTFANDASGDPIYGQSFKCSKKGVVDDGITPNRDLDGDGLTDPEDFFCNESENRQNDGDTLVTTLMWVDINGKGR